MNQFVIVAVILVIGLGTFSFRYSFLALQDRLHTPRWFRRALSFVPVTVLPALIAPQLVFRDGALDLSLDNPRWLAGIVALVMAAWTKHAVLTIVVGLVSLWLIQWLV